MSKQQTLVILSYYGTVHVMLRIFNTDDQHLTLASFDG